MKLYKDAFKDLEFVVGVLQSKGYTYGMSVIEEWNKTETSSYFLVEVVFYEVNPQYKKGNPVVTFKSQYKGSIPVATFKTEDKADYYSKKVLKKLDKKLLTNK